ncbi:MAG: DUF4375 domain-containing protein [Planctomycetaceae bacterium]
MSTNPDAENDLLKRINEAEDSSQRAALIDLLEATPANQICFYERWLRLHQPWASECWTDTGYDPSLSAIPRDVQLLAGMCYGKSDIENGGLHQLFANGTGAMAPEMKQWCERAGFQKTANILAEAIAVFGPEFPRSQNQRDAFLRNYSEQAHTRGERDSWNPFRAMDERFYASFDGKFDAAADQWLRDVCGVGSLHDTPEEAK